MVCLKLRRGDREQLGQGPTGRAGWGTVSAEPTARTHMTATCFTVRPALDAAFVEALVEVEPS
jgi:hypothetical protein